MGISDFSDTLANGSNNLQQDSDLHLSIRRRPNASVVASVNESSSKKTKEESGGETENWSKDSGLDSGSTTNSEEGRSQTRNYGDADDRKEDRRDCLNVNGRQDISCERIGNGGDQDRSMQAEVAMKYVYRASAPAHRRVKESPLSSDAIFRQSHAGLFNLCIVVLVAVNSRLIIENLMKYGLLIRAGFWFSSKSLKEWPLLMCCLSLPIFPFGAFLVEKLAQHKFISEPVVVSSHVIITTATVLYPVFMILRFDSAVLSGITLMLFASIVWLKLVSYAHTNYDMRALSKSVNEGDVLSKSTNTDCSYDVSFKSLVYFMLAPTLCYQPSYPRTACIRKGWVIRQLVKLIIFTGVMGFIIEQYINPIVQNSQHPLKGDLLNALERVLKLSVPTLYVWLCMFYCFFHLWYVESKVLSKVQFLWSLVALGPVNARLNILAELLRFGDREFYKDWWNAKTVEEYWRMWNMPVHKWMVRHIYFPCMRNGIPKGVAIIIVFFLSAVFHELCIAVPCRIFKLWAFMGIMFQVPLVLLTKYVQDKFKNAMVGNMIFWFIFCIFGQPMCVLLYYHDLMNEKSKS